MATGVPKTAQQCLSTSGISLHFEGKRTADDILKATPVDFEVAWRGIPATNRLYFADNEDVLPTLLRDPDVRGQVRLVYIDPPFATKTVFHSRSLSHAYEDMLVGDQYLAYMQTRLVLLHELLADDGSAYVHIDEKMLFHLKVLMDEVFGPSNFRNCITRKKCNPKNYTRRTYGKVADYLLFYTKSSNYIWNRPVEPWTEERAKEYRYVEPVTGRRFMKVPVHAPGIRNGETGKPWRGMQPPLGKHWQYPPSVLDEMDARGEIFWSENGNPRRKVYLDESPGVGVQDIWLGFRDAHNQNICITGYPTEKNPDLLRRIISASSNPGDLVLDCFSGSGTTLAVASETHRRWIGVDCGVEAIATTLRRFARGTSPMGDFVSKQQKQNRPAKSKMPLLFEIAEEPPAAEAVPSERVTDFQLLVRRGNRSDIKDSLGEWESIIGKSENVSPATQDRSGIIQRLKSSDRRLAAIMDIVEPLECGIRSPFEVLVSSIVSQQLSKDAAATIEGRLRSLFPRRIVTARQLLKIEDAKLRKCGLSRRKCDCLKDAAKASSRGGLDIVALAKMDDEEVIERLCSIRGVGRWTAQMFLMFGIAREDVFPVDDAALRRAIKRAYDLNCNLDPNALRGIGDAWRPFRSLGCKYLYSWLNAGFPEFRRSA